MNSEIIETVRDLVFDGTINVQGGRLLEYLLLNSHKSKHHMNKVVCEFDYANLSEKFKMSEPNLRYHVRALEKKGLLVQSYLFMKDGCEVHVEGFEQAKKFGLRAVKETYFTIKVENFYGGEL